MWKRFKKYALIAGAAIALVLGILALFLLPRRRSSRGGSAWESASKRIAEFQLKKREIEAKAKVEILKAREDATEEREELEHALAEPDAEKRLNRLSDLMKDY